MKQTIKYNKLYEELSKRSSQAVLSRLRHRNEPLRKFIQEEFSKRYSEKGSFLADPVFEATFGWESYSKTLKELSEEGLINKDLLRNLENPPKEYHDDYALEAPFFPYAHQYEAWKSLTQKDPRSVVVTSGTGSGKTECFAVPLLNDLAREVEESNSSLNGVRALFLYPLNALINSQKNRLSAWTRGFNGKIRYCLYNGETPDTVPQNQQGPSIGQPELVKSREELRSNTPPILVTNATMLEYMMVRYQDKRILNNSQGKLRWIVLDEAHTYIGSQAAEISLLLRRVMHSFGVKPENVRFVATSATIGNDNEREVTDRKLKEFLSNISGVPEKQIDVVHGQRLVPKVQKQTLESRISLENYEREEIAISSLPTEEEQKTAYKELSSVIFNQLSSNKQMMKLREEIVQKPHSLSDITKIIFPGKTDHSQEEKSKALRFLDLATRAYKDGDIDNNQAFLPVRAHFFHRAQKGFWACINPNCSCKKNTCLDSDKWPFGHIYLNERSKCECGSLVFELVNCGECGSPALNCKIDIVKGGTQKLISREEQDIDEYQDDIDQEENITYESVDQHSCQVFGVGNEHTQEYYLNHQTRNLSCSEEKGLQKIYLTRANEANQLSCCYCGTKEKAEGRLFKRAMLGAPFLLGSIIPTLLDFAPGDNPKDSKDLKGRRLITFSDSRQGTARFAAKIQLDSERNFVRSYIYHKLLHSTQSLDPEMQEVVDALRNINFTDEQIIAKVPAAAQLLGQGAAQYSWQKAVLDISESIKIKDVAKEVYKNRNVTLGDSKNLAQLFLYREFARRPKNQNNPESMGLVSITYPSLGKKSELPYAWETHGLTSKDWQDFLKICLDFYIRENSFVEIPEDYINWMGAKVYPKYLLPTDYPGEPEFRQQKWVQINGLAGRNQRLVRLLCLATGLNPDDDSELINDWLDQAWRKTNSLLTRGDYGSQLSFEKCSFSLIKDAFLCPFTNRILDTTFKGYSPYSPRTLANEDMPICEPITIPKPDFAFSQDSEGKYISLEDVHNWLNSQEVVTKGRNQGFWTDLNDRLIEEAPLIRSGEHSAQQKKEMLQDLEHNFNSGKLQILSCSTTMEMGVDIGSMSMVAMNNVPPGPANYLQRAGRAGRRKESASLALTFCKSNPHGERVFENPKWPFETPISLPKVTLESRPIVIRHVNAMVLSRFLHHMLGVHGENILSMETGRFYLSDNENTKSLLQYFGQWIKEEALSDEGLTSGVNTLVKGSPLYRDDTSNLIIEAQENLQSAYEKWHEQYKALVSVIEDFDKEPNQNKYAISSLRRRKERMEKEYLLSELASRGFLPGYGFPTGVVNFVTDNKVNHELMKVDKKPRERNSNNNRGYPSRGLSMAIREYAPGAEIVLDGCVYKSAGVLMNWKRPFSQSQTKELQQFRHVYQCRSCGTIDTYSTKPEVCPNCQSEDLRTEEYLEPTGFAVDFNEEPHNDYTQTNYQSVEPPSISLGHSKWQPLPMPEIGRYRTNANGKVFFKNSGTHEKGYAVCLQCGKTEPMNAQGEIPKSMDSHDRIQGLKKDKSVKCIGNRDDWSIKPNVILGHEAVTGVFELQLNDPETRLAISDETLMYSLGVALREVLCEKLGITTSEIGIEVQQNNLQNSSPYCSLFLYDQASQGAGFSEACGYYLQDLLVKAKDVLKCSNNCEKACHTCLLEFDTQHHIKKLDRHTALSLLNNHKFISGLSIPESKKYFEESIVELETMEEVMLSSLKPDLKELRVFLGGDSADWNWPAWSIRKLLMTSSWNGQNVKLVITKENAEQMDEDLACMIKRDCEQFGIVAVSVDQQPLLANNGFLLAEAVMDHKSVSWAMATADYCEPDEQWGSSEQEVIIRGEQPTAYELNEQVLSFSEKASQSIMSNAKFFTVKNEMDCCFEEFGFNFWRVVLEEAPKLEEKLKLGISEVSYVDRYVKSPWAAGLLFQILSNLKKRFQAESFSLTIGEAREHDRSIYTAFHDWDDSSDQLKTIESLAEIHSFDMSVAIQDGRSLPHGRKLTITLANGSTVSLVLDMGVGYWSCSGNARFSFDQPAKAQAYAIKNLSLGVRGSSDQESYITVVY